MVAKTTGERVKWRLALVEFARSARRGLGVGVEQLREAVEISVGCTCVHVCACV